MLYAFVCCMNRLTVVTLSENSKRSNKLFGIVHQKILASLANINIVYIVDLVYIVCIFDIVDIV